MKNHRLKHKSKSTTKTLQGNRGEYLHTLQVSKGFLDTQWKEIIIKEENDILDFIKI